MDSETELGQVYFLVANSMGAVFNGLDPPRAAMNRKDERVLSSSFWRFDHCWLEVETFESAIGDRRILTRGAVRCGDSMKTISVKRDMF